MPTDLTIELDDRPGELARLGEAVGGAGVNLEGLCAVVAGGRAELHLTVEDAPAARGALEAVGLRVAGQQEVLVVACADEPGAVGRVARRMADAGVNITLVYLATETRLVLGVDDLEKARAAL